MSEGELICGLFRDVFDVANAISGTHHNILLGRKLIFAYKGTEIIKSFIVTSGPRYNTYSISIFYDGYSMVQSTAKPEELDIYIKNITDKKLKLLKDMLISRLYG